MFYTAVPGLFQLYKVGTFLRLEALSIFIQILILILLCFLISMNFLLKSTCKTYLFQAIGYKTHTSFYLNKTPLARGFQLHLNLRLKFPLPPNFTSSISRECHNRGRVITNIGDRFQIYSHSISSTQVGTTAKDVSLAESNWNLSRLPKQQVANLGDS